MPWFANHTRFRLESLLSCWSVPLRPKPKECRIVSPTLFCSARQASPQRIRPSPLGLGQSPSAAVPHCLPSPTDPTAPTLLPSLLCGFERSRLIGHLRYRTHTSVSRGSIPLPSPAVPFRPKSFVYAREMTRHRRTFVLFFLSICVFLAYPPFATPTPFSLSTFPTHLTSPTNF